MSVYNPRNPVLSKLSSNDWQLTFKIDKYPSQILAQGSSSISQGCRKIGFNVSGPETGSLTTHIVTSSPYVRSADERDVEGSLIVNSVNNGTVKIDYP